MKTSVIIVAGGSGQRFGGELPKQFVILQGRPVLMHTLEVMGATIPDSNLVVVLPSEEEGRWVELCKEYACRVDHMVVSGGATRSASVRNGLAKVDEGIVLVHDGVRPLVSPDVIQRVVETTLKKGNAIPVLPVTDSIRSEVDHATKSLSREGMVTVQTPQGFRLEDLRSAYKQIGDAVYTDDASVLESAGATIHHVEGNKQNIKITTKEDLVVAHAFMEKL